jgi:peptide/nickel transport system substrate-binding protein
LPYRTLRTIGATVVLAGVVIAGVTQIAAREPVDTDIGATGSSTSTLETTTTVEPTTTLPGPFVYRLAVLSGATTDNFWAFYGAEPSVWNAYVLGPTKPALYTAHAAAGRLQPELALAEVEPQRDETGWHVMVDLNPELRWSDGVGVTAHDVLFTFEVVRSLKLKGSWSEAFPKTVESMRAESDNLLRIDFTKRPQLSVWPFGVGLAPIMAEHIWEDRVQGLDRKSLYALSGEEDVGGGPLAIDSVGEDLIVSVANPGYLEDHSPDVVEYHVFADEEAALDALVAGSVDSILSPRGLTAGQIDTIEAPPVVEFANSPGNAVRYLGFNLDRDPMSDQAFRTALALLLDRQELAEAISGTGAAAWSFMPEANTKWFDEDANAAIEDNYKSSLKSRLERALQGLRDAGYAWDKVPSVQDGKLIAGSGLSIDGQPPQTLTILTPGDAYDPARPVYVGTIASTLVALGFDARPIETDFDTVIDLAFTPGEDGELHYDMYLLGWTLGNQALPSYHGTLFASDGPMNNTRYSSEDFDAALSAYSAAVTNEQAVQALWEMESILARDLPYLPLYTSQITEAYRSDLVQFDAVGTLGGLQGRLGGIWDVKPAS